MWMAQLFDSLNNGLEGLLEKHLALKLPRLAFLFNTVCLQLWPLSKQSGRPLVCFQDQKLSKHVSELDDRPRLPCKEERNPPLRVLWCRALSVPAWPLISVHRESEDIFFYCLARSLALNAACHTRSSCWWKHMPNLCLNVYNFLCLLAGSSPPPPI